MISVEGDISEHLSFRLAGNSQDVHIFNSTNNAISSIVAPTDGNAVDHQWSEQINPIRNRNYWHLTAIQGAAVYKVDFGKVVSNQFIVGGEARLKQQYFIQQRLYQTDANGNYVAGTDFLGRKLFTTLYAPVQTGYPGKITPMAGYVWADNAVFNAAPVTAANPRGLASSTALTWRTEKQVSGYVNWLGTWFGDRAETMAGVRLDKVTLENTHINQLITDTTAKSGLVGVVFNVTPDWGIYGNTSKSFAAAGTFMPDVDNNFPQPGKGVSSEVGLKFDVWNKRISGSLAFFDNKSENEALALPAATRNILDPAGLNGRNGGTGATANVHSRGVELVLTAQPAKGWRLYLSLGTNDATITSGYSHPVSITISSTRWAIT